MQKTAASGRRVGGTGKHHTPPSLGAFAVPVFLTGTVQAPNVLLHCSTTKKSSSARRRPIHHCSHVKPLHTPAHGIASSGHTTTTPTNATNVTTTAGHLSWDELLVRSVNGTE